jgi:hypothetical protein
MSRDKDHVPTRRHQGEPIKFFTIAEVAEQQAYSEVEQLGPSAVDRNSVSLKQPTTVTELNND